LHFNSLPFELLVVLLMQCLSVVGVFWIVDGVCEFSVTGDDDQGKLIDNTVMKVLLFNFGIIKHLFVIYRKKKRWCLIWGSLYILCVS